MIHPSIRRGVTLLELTATLAILAILGAMLSAAIAESRRHASLTQNFANLQQFAAGTTTYAADWEDRYWAFTWKAGHDGPFGVPGSDTQAMADQAVDIMNRRGGMAIGRLTGFFPGALYSHLVLLDHLGTNASPRWVVSPEDTKRLLWQDDPFNMPIESRPPGTHVERWAFSSSYELAPAFYEADARQGTVNTLSQHGLTYNSFSPAPERHGSRFLHEVAFPSQKVMMFERRQRYFGGREIVFMDDEARVALLMADGSAAVRRTADANSGFRPNSPALNAPTLLRYEPTPLDPPIVNGGFSQILTGHYRWTRGGLKGRDFDAGEIDTSDW